MSPFFICQQDEVNSKLKTLIKTGISDDGWTHCYTDQLTNQEWLLTRFHSERQGGGVSVLKRLPRLTTEELITIAVNSSDTNDIIGASNELLEREEFYKEDFREKLLQRLLQFNTPDLMNFDRGRLRTIICESQLCDAKNKRDIMGKYFTEVETDAKYYQFIAQQAKLILASLGK